MALTDHKIAAMDIFQAALKAVDPYELMKAYAEKVRSVYTDGRYSRLLVVGFGKASYHMAKALEEDLPNMIDTGIIITKYGHAINRNTQYRDVKPGIRIFEANHPVPDRNGSHATEEIIKLLKDADEKTLVVCLISGGGSALLVSPYENISLKDKQVITGLLLTSGADINELNTVRKHISKVKGGRLAQTAFPARVISLIISDVIGDRLDVIASGPTSPDSTTYQDALSVLDNYKLLDQTPLSVLEVLQKGAEGLLPDTPKSGNDIFNNVENIIVGNNTIALNTAKQKAEEIRLRAEILSAKLTGDAKDIGKQLAMKAITAKREAASDMKSERILCYISGGETTVTVTGNGLGGRNMELALAFAREVEGIDGITLLSAGTDGTDGPTDAAGAIVDGETVKKARVLGLVPEEYLFNNDSYNFFNKAGGLFMTGPTGTNVMDIQVMVIK